MHKSNELKFDVKKFYLDIIAFDPEEVNHSNLDTTQKIMDLNKRLKAKEFKKRCLGRVFFELGEDFKIGICL